MGGAYPLGSLISNAGSSSLLQFSFVFEVLVLNFSLSFIFLMWITLVVPPLILAVVSLDSVAIFLVI